MQLVLHRQDKRACSVSLGGQNATDTSGKPPGPPLAKQLIG